MGFYSVLSRYYDEIFPPSPQALAFLREVLTGHRVRKVLDVACGTGRYAVELATWGLKVSALDFAWEMAQQVEEKARAAAVQVEVRVGDMRQVPRYFPGPFHAVLCLGNSLAHLTEKGEIETFFERVHFILRPGGLFILQVVNFDRILSQGIRTLPTIEREGLIFERYYDPGYLPGTIYFRTRLRVDRPPEPPLDYTARTLLRPVRAAELTAWLAEKGFGELELYGDFDRRPHDEEAPAIVVVARKKPEEPKGAKQEAPVVDPAGPEYK
ncbi:MAG: class I SAM-dependent methyltransferase [Bacillota bacterium]|nr:class I SAM-dependent methyltransferase [Bacillota bacterium]